ncbi:MAG: hypothetical protein ACYDHY_18200 [Acidiferrobacterales bacterium]
MMAKNHTRTTKPELLSRLMDLAGRAVEEQNSKTRHAESSLHRAVQSALEKGDDRQVQEAIDALESLHLEKEADLLRFHAVESAWVCAVSIQTPTGLVSGEAQMFLIPILLGTEDGKPVPRGLPAQTGASAESPLRAATHSFRRHGLIGPGPGLALLPRLYEFSDLPHTWSQQRGLLRRIVASLVDEPALDILPAESERTPRRHIALRFLVLCALVTDNDKVAGPLINGDLLDLINLDDADAMAAFTGWKNDFEHIVENMDGVSLTVIGVPGPYTDALFDGIDMNNVAELKFAIDKMFGSVIPRQAYATISVHFSGRTARLSITLHSPAGGRIVADWDCVDSVETEIDTARRNLGIFGIGQVDIDPITRDEESAKKITENTTTGRYPIGAHPRHLH